MKMIKNRKLIIIIQRRYKFKMNKLKILKIITKEIYKYKN